MGLPPSLRAYFCARGEDTGHRLKREDSGARCGQRREGREAAHGPGRVPAHSLLLPQRPQTQLLRLALSVYLCVCLSLWETRGSVYKADSRAGLASRTAVGLEAAQSGSPWGRPPGGWA